MLAIMRIAGEALVMLDDGIQCLSCFLKISVVVVVMVVVVVVVVVVV